MAGRLTAPARAGRGAHAWIDACGAASALAYAWLAHASYTPPVPLVPYFAVLAFGWTLLLTLYARSERAGTPLPLLRIVAWALVFRAIGLVGMPVLEDDFYRYLWDGRTLVLTGSPYGVAPMDSFDDASVSLVFQHVLDGINNPHVPTIYPPLCQALFGLGYLVAPGQIWPIKLVLVAADLGTLALLIRLLPVRRVLLYAWCPLLVQETAFSAHPDSLGVFLMVAAFVAAARQRLVVAAMCAALAVGSKGLALLLLPFVLRRIGWRYALLSLSVLAALYAPFLAVGGASEAIGLLTFLAEWEFNSTLFALLAMLFGPEAAKVIGLVGVALVGALLIRTERPKASPLLPKAAGLPPPAPVLPRGDVLFGCLFLAAPVVNPWYLLWMLPFVAARPSAWGISALAAVSLSYAHGLFIAGLDAYHHPWWIRPTELAIVAVGLAVSSFGRGSGSRIRSFFRRGTQGRSLGGSALSHHRLGKVALIAAMALAIGGAGVAQASGSYRGRPANPSTSIDRAQYELGKKVFAGQFPRSENAGQAASQRSELDALQAKLPLRARGSVDLPSLAGQIDDEQLSALQYFLEKRYKVQ